MAGGKASRFGGFPKGLALVGEERMADRALAALRGATDAQVIVSNDARAAEWFPGSHIVPDREPGLGPLAGLETALTAAAGASVIVVAWDMPFVETPLLRGMRALCELGADAVVPEHGTPLHSGAAVRPAMPPPRSPLPPGCWKPARGARPRWWTHCRT